MLIAMSAVYGVQVLARYDLLAAEIRDAPRAAAECIRDVALPEMISGVTTIIGFASLMVAPQPAIQDFALFSIFGVSAMQLIAVTGLPALLAMLPLPAVAPEGNAQPTPPMQVLARAVDAFLVRMATLATTWPNTILIVWAVLIAAAAAVIPGIVVDTDYLSFFDSRSDVRRDFARASERLVGAAPIYIMVSGAGEGAFREPANVQALERLQRLVEAVPGVSTTLSIVDFLAALNRAYRGRRCLGRARADDPRGDLAVPLHDPEGEAPPLRQRQPQPSELAGTHRHERLGGGRCAPSASRRGHRGGPSAA